MCLTLTEGLQGKQEVCGHSPFSSKDTNVQKSYITYPDLPTELLSEKGWEPYVFPTPQD